MLSVLQKISRRHTSSVRLVQRAEIILAVHGHEGPEVASRAVEVSRSTFYKWVGRAKRLFEKFTFDPEWSESQRMEKVAEVLEDAPRPGVPLKYDQNKVCSVMATALRPPIEFGIQTSHWSISDLTFVLNRDGIAPGISRATTWRILDEADIRPHKTQYWLNPTIDDQQQFDDAVRNICTLYRTAAELLTMGVRVVSADEKTGIQALERIHPDKPMQAGTPQRIEFEYHRHGTTALIASFTVAEGGIAHASIGPTRDEADYARHIREMVAKFPDDRLIIINDNLTTHKSESLVKLVAVAEGIPMESLGEKGKSGILKDVQSRQSFLEDRNHKIAFAYTPKHCSWLNQIEIWFGILSRKLLKRTSFCSVEELQTKIIEFIGFFNEYLAHPFRWTYEGKALKV